MRATAARGRVTIAVWREASGTRDRRRCEPLLAVLGSGIVVANVNGGGGGRTASTEVSRDPSHRALERAAHFARLQMAERLPLELGAVCAVDAVEKKHDVKMAG